MEVRQRECKVCTSFDIGSLDKLLVLGHSPRRLVRNWGYSRKAIERHRDECLVDERRARVIKNLRVMARLEGPGDDDAA